MKKVLLLVVAALLVSTGQLLAAAISITDVTGFFQDYVPNPGFPPITVNNGTGHNSTIRWGLPASLAGRSGYNFDSEVPPNIDFVIPPTPSAWFLLGDFTHVNQPILGSALTQTDLELDLLLTVDGTGVNPSFLYTLFHDETPNRRPCPIWQQSGIACDDRVDISSPSSGTFTVDGVDYTLTLGFSTDGGQTILDHFITQERQDNVAGIYGQFTATTPPPVIPEPTSLLLLGTGLTGLALAGWRKRK